MQALHFISAAAPGTTSLINGSTQEWASPNSRHGKARWDKIIQNRYYAMVSICLIVLYNQKPEKVIALALSDFYLTVAIVAASKPVPNTIT